MNPIVQEAGGTVSGWLVDALAVSGTILGTAVAFAGALWVVAKLVGPTLRDQTKAVVEDEFKHLGARLEMIDEHFERRFAGLNQRLDRIEGQD